MKLIRRRRLLEIVSACAASVAFPLATRAQGAYPTKPIKLTVPYAAGSNADQVARLITPKWAEILGQPVVIENRVGAGGTIGAAYLAKTAPDGYNLLLGNAPTHTSGPAWQKVPYDPVADFVPISRLVSSDYTLAVGPALPVKSVSDLVAYIRKQPRDISYASLGDGTGVHLSALGLARALGVELKQVPYSSNGPALVDVSTGTVTMIFYPYPPMAGMVQSGKLRVLASTGARRAVATPELPTMIESGVNYSETSWHGLFAPQGVPREVIDTLYTTLMKAMADPSVIAGMRPTGVGLDPLSPAQFADFVKSQAAFYRALHSKG